MKAWTDESALMDGINNGDPNAMRSIYDRYVRQLCFFSEQIIANTQASEDIAAESFIKVFQGNSKFTSLEKLKSYLFTIARNASLDYLKSTQRHEQAHQRIRQISAEIAESVEEAFLRAEARQIIYGEIEKLPASTREVVMLSFIEGRSAAEISAELNIAHQTVLNHKSKGIKFLRIAVLKNRLLETPVVIAAILMLK